MPWFKVDDKFHDHRKSRRARKAAIGVWTLAGSWSMDHLTDGFIPQSVLGRWGTKHDAKVLVVSELWDESSKDGEDGWQFRNWDEFQPSKAEIEAEREATKKRVADWRNKRRNGVTNEVTNGTVTPEVQTPRPDPTRPDPSIGAAKRATQLPDAFRPSTKHEQLAMEKGVNLRAEWPQFCDHHRAKGSTMKDWDAALNTWIRNAAKFGGTNVRQFPTSPDGQPIIGLARDDKR